MKDQSKAKTKLLKNYRNYANGPAEEAIQKSEAKYRKLHESMRDGFVFVSMDGMIKECNVSYREMIGYTQEEISKLTYRDITTEKWHVFEQKIVEQQILTRGYSEVYEKEYCKKDGTVIPVELRTFLMKDETGSNIGMWAIVRDITERKRIEASLQKSEEKYRLLVENAAEGIFVAQDGFLKFMNPKTIEIIGYSKEKLTTRPFVEFIHPDDREMVLDRHLKRLQGKEVPSSYPFRIDGKTGIVKWVEIKAILITWEGKLATLNFMTDITDRKEVEETLKQSQEMLKKTFASLREAVFIVDDKTGKIMDCNPAGSEIFGYRQDEMLGKTTDFLHVDKAGFEEFKQHLYSAIEREGSLSLLECRMRRKNGEIFVAEHTVSPLKDNQGDRMAWVGVMRDITRRKRGEKALRDSEEKFRELFDHAPMGYLEYDREGRITNVNRTGLQMLGYTAEEMLGQPVWKYNSNEEESREKILSKLSGVLPSNKNFERVYRRKDGTAIPVLLHDRPILDEKREIKGIRYMIQDITQLKQMEKEKTYLIEQLHQAQKMEAIGTLAGGIAHDFNNILSAILGYAELADLDIKENSKAKYNLQQSMKAAHRAKDLVQQILASSRQERQERKPLDIKPIIEEGLKFLRASLPATIEIRQDIEEELGVIEADPTQVHQVLMNLCTNAAHAMAEEGGVLEISLRNLDMNGGTSAVSQRVEPGPYLRLRVSDTGHGIPPEILSKIFDPYFTTKEVGKGTGLGLAVVHGILKSYGGEITVSSEVGKGSTFDIYFPKTEVVNLPPEAGKGEPLLLGGRERVLIVDDEKAIVEIGRDILEYLGYKAVVRTSSIEALELFRVQSDRFDLVITDMTMPNMRGDKLAQELLRIRPGIPIILCTGFSEHITEEKAKAIGIREFVMKPLAMKELEKAIRRALDHDKKRRI